MIGDNAGNRKNPPILSVRCDGYMENAMPNELNIPDEYKTAFNRLMRKMPAEAREDATIRKTALLYLKVGGEKLAIAGVKALVTPFSEKFILRKMQISDEEIAVKTDSASNGTTDGNTEDKGKAEATKSETPEQ